jgi:hypothetical protein
MTATPRPRFDQWLLAQTDREDPVGDIARELSEDRSVGCAGDICTPEQLISHIERVHHAIDLAIRAVEQARAEYLRGRVDPLRARAEMGATTVLLDTCRFMTDAQRLYRSRGFVEGYD